MKKVIITIDGPAGSGKSTTAKLVAKRLGFLYLDTGAMYRAIALKALRQGIDLDDERSLEKLAVDTEIDIIADPDGCRVFLDGEDVSERIRTREVTQASSKVSAVRGVRRRLIELQRRIGSGGGIVAEGRDIGSVVFPDAEIKIYLDADIRTRALRRMKEMKEKCEGICFEKIKADIERRDKQDANRDLCPLVVPEGAKIIDTSNLSIEEQVDEVLNEVKRRLDKRS
ncbi:MAG: (d)CMP kinase [bacterium]